jgi:FMN phosphatase YigB (HAD superfamily)
MPSDESVPAELAPKLIHRFMSNEGYELQPGASETLRHLRESSRKNFDRVIVGVITNSDPRVPDVLSSLGLAMGPLRYGTRSQVSQPDG